MPVVLSPFFVKLGCMQCDLFESSVFIYLEFSIQKSSPVSALTLSRRSASSSICWQNLFTAFCVTVFNLVQDQLFIFHAVL